MEEGPLQTEGRGGRPGEGRPRVHDGCSSRRSAEANAETGVVGTQALESRSAGHPRGRRARGVLLTTLRTEPALPTPGFGDGHLLSCTKSPLEWHADPEGGGRSLESWTQVPVRDRPITA